MLARLKQWVKSFWNTGPSFKCLYCNKKHYTLHELEVCQEWDKILSRKRSIPQENVSVNKLPDECD